METMEPQINLQGAIEDMADLMGKSEMDAISYLMHCISHGASHDTLLQYKTMSLSSSITLMFLGALRDGSSSIPPFTWSSSVQPDDATAPTIADFSFRLRTLKEILHSHDISHEEKLWEKWKYGREKPVFELDCKATSPGSQTSDFNATSDQLAEIFPMGLPPASKVWWREHASKAARNGLRECRVNTGKGKGKSLFDVIKVGDWLTRPRQGKTLEWVNSRLSKNHPNPDMAELLRGQ